MTRARVLDELAGWIAAVERPHPVRVALDGIDAAGKTTLADELVAPLRARKRTVIRASVDGFHHPRAHRYRKGPESPEGYYADSFDYSAVIEQLLEPLGPKGERLYRTAVFDYSADCAVEREPRRAEPDAVLLFDGIFLLRPELRPFWDFAVFVEVAFPLALERSCERAAARGEDADRARQHALRRALPGQRIYLEECDPRRRADVVLDNDDPERPRIDARRTGDARVPQSAGAPHRKR